VSELKPFYVYLPAKRELSVETETPPQPVQHCDYQPLDYEIMLESLKENRGYACSNV